ncbi:MAG: DUF4129 domain-containing protein [Spirochaetes bacterium]|jgi:hypothetical protein|nr:DUF4129 domain-containing protein [Spirochaetota bacterium]
MATLRHEAVYREIIHPVLALLPPVVGGLAAASLLEDLLARDILSPLFALAVVTASVIETVVGNLVSAHRGGWEARLREFLLVAGLSYLLFAVAGGGAGNAAAGGSAAAGAADAAGAAATAARVFAPRLDVVARVILVAGTWFAVHRRHEAFRPREDFLRSVQGRVGRELRHTMRDTRGFATDILLRLRETSAAAATGFVLLLTASALVWASEQRLSARSFALIALYAPVSLLVAGLIHAFCEEFAVYGEGIRVPNRFLRRLATAAGILVLAALALSLPFARNASPLSPAAVPAWFEALRSWFASLPEAEVPDPGRFTMPPAGGFLGDYDIPPGVLAASRFWDTFSRVFRTVAFVVAAVGVAVFLAWPVFSRRFRRQVRASRPGRRVIEYLLGILSLGALVLHTLSRLARRFVSGAWGFLGGSGRGGGPGGQAGDTGGAPTGAGGRAAAPEVAPLRLRRQRHVILRKLDEIAEAGTKKGAPFEPSQTTREYSRMLQLSYPGLAGALQTVVRTAEKALYSNHHLARGELRNFVEAARSVVRTLQDAATG